MRFQREQLDNGLNIVAECNDAAHTAAYGFFVETGARDETDGLAGVSHFLEHMVFKGTPTRDADDVNRQFDEMGAHYNAFTSEESTVYYAAVLPEQQEQAIDLLADIMRPSLREEDFEMEKQVILEEIQMYDDQPPYGADDRLKEIFFGPHPLARSVLGTSQSVSNLSVAEMRDYFQTRYSPANIFVAAAGRVDFDKLVDAVRARCGPWPTTSASRDVPDFQPRRAFEAVPRTAAHQQYILQLAPAPHSGDELRYVAKILATMIGDDSGSRMYWEFVDPGIVDHASLGHYEYQGAGIYYTWASCEPARAEEILAGLAALYDHVERNGFDADELEQAKSKVKSRVVLGGERPRNRLFAVGGNWMQRHEYRSVRDDLDAVDRVTLEAAHELLERMPISNNATITIGPRTDLQAPHPS